MFNLGAPCVFARRLRAPPALSATLLTLLWCSASTPAPAETRESRPGVYVGYSQARYDFIKTSQYVPVRDGVRLAVDIYRPALEGRAVEGRFPVVWAHTPYRRAYVDPAGKTVTTVERLGILELVKHGYVVAAVDTRGRGASFGVRRGFQDRTEAQDAYDMTEWFAAQSWSTGAVGVTGCSYLGGTTWHAATTKPPHLRAIAPGCTDFDKYGFVSRGGVTAQFNTRPEDPGQDYGQGVLPVDADTDGALAKAAIAAHAAGTPMAELWRGMPHRDDVSPLLGVKFWEEASVATYARQIEESGVGVFIWGNWLDEGSFEATLAFNNLRNPRKLWMGGWGHCQVGDFAMTTELLRFFDHFLKKVDNGWNREPPIHYRTLNAAPGQEWRSGTAWPPADAKSTVLHLTMDHSRRALALAAPEGAARGVDRFTVNYAPRCRDSVNTAFMMWPCVIENHGVSYTTAPLAGDLHIAGHPLADLWIASSAKDADVFVYLEDVSPSGESAIVTHGRLRASHRSEQTAPYRNYMGLPYHRGERGDVQPLEPGEPARLRLDLLPTSTIVKAGHRVRLTIAGADPRQRSRTVQFDPAPTITVYRDDTRRSQIALPIASEVNFGPATTALPRAEGPIATTQDSEPYAAANARGAPGALDLARSGYIEEEYFLSGRASRYAYDDAFNVRATSSDIPYTTRLLLRRPADPERFSGVVHIESAHPLQGGHSGWSATAAHILRRGDAYALVHTGEDALTRGGPIAPEREALRAQLQSGGAPPLGAMTVLQRFDSKRYAPISWPEDDAPRWDAFAQAGAWLKSSDTRNPLRNRARRLYAQGWSFTGSLLRTFINEGFHDGARLASGAPVFDGYLIGISSSTFVSGVIALTTGGPTLPLGHAHRVTGSIDVPVIELMTENEAVTNTGPQAPQNDQGAGRHRLYEVGGLTHGDGLAPQGFESTARWQLSQRGLPTRSFDDACELPRSDAPFHLLARAALANLHEWVEHDRPPPRAPRLSLDARSRVVRDAVGNAQGGVRIAQLEAPLAVYAVPDERASPACRTAVGPFLRIRRQPLAREQLDALYADAPAFLRAFDAQIDALVAQRFILAEDAVVERETARTHARQAWRGT